MNSNGTESLRFDTFSKFKQWKESLKTDRGLQFSFQWSRVQNGSQQWRYTCKHVRITNTHPHKFAYMLVIIEVDGKVHVELNAPNINHEVFGDGSSPLRGIESSETTQSEEPEENPDEIIKEEGLEEDNDEIVQQKEPEADSTEAADLETPEADHDETAQQGKRLLSSDVATESEKPETNHADIAQQGEPQADPNAQAQSEEPEANHDEIAHQGEEGSNPEEISQSGEPETEPSEAIRMREPEAGPDQAEPFEELGAESNTASRISKPETIHDERTQENETEVSSDVLTSGNQIEDDTGQPVGKDAEPEENAQDCTESVPPLKKLKRVKEPDTDESGDVTPNKFVVKHARPWESTSAVSFGAKIDVSIEVGADAGTDPHLGEHGEATQPEESSCRKKFKNSVGTSDDIVKFSEPTAERALNTDRPQQKLSSEMTSQEQSLG